MSEYTITSDIPQWTRDALKLAGQQKVETIAVILPADACDGHAEEVYVRSFTRREAWKGLKHAFRHILVYGEFFLLGNAVEVGWWSGFARSLDVLRQLKNPTVINMSEGAPTPSDIGS